MDLRPPLPEEEQAVRSLLVSAALPVDDLADADVRFIVAIDNGAPVGAIGLESFGRVGLLRSLVVDPGLRGTGIGHRLVEALEARARAAGLDQLALLTQTAEAFFAARGYHVVGRDEVPESVRASAEFRSLCPASATCMTKRLDGPA